MARTKTSALPQAQQESPVRAHEKSDWNLKWVVWLVVGIGASAFVIHAALWWWLDSLPGPARLDEAARWQAAGQRGPEARQNYPRLQLSPERDWQAYLAKEEQLLHSYGWVNQREGIVRLPIEQAMAIIAERGLPEWGRGQQTGRGPSPLEYQHQRAREAEPSSQ